MTASELPREWMSRFCHVGNRVAWEYGESAPFWQVGISAGREFDSIEEIWQRMREPRDSHRTGRPDMQFPTWSAAVEWCRERP